MSEHHEELWAEINVLKRRIALQEQRLTDRIIVLENEMAELKRAREMHQEDVELEIVEIMRP